MISNRHRSVREGCWGLDESSNNFPLQDIVRAFKIIYSHTFFCLKSYGMANVSKGIVHSHICVICDI